MEMIFYCGECGKFFYADPEGLTPCCVHCGSDAIIMCQSSKERYLTLSEDQKSQWKAGVRSKYPNKEAIINYYVEAQLQEHRNALLGVLFQIKGVRGRTLFVCRNKCIIKTDVTAGSVITGNATDGEKVIFYRDCAALQFKQSGLTIGYLQFETPSMQMNNMDSNFFSENTFTFSAGVNGVTNEIMRDVFYYVLELMENQKYQINPDTVPEFPHWLKEYLGK